MGRPQKLPKILPSLARTLGRFWPQVRKQRRLLTGAFAALFAEVGLKLLEPWPLKFIFDHVISVGAPNGSSSSTPIGGMSPTRLLTFSAIGLVAIVAARATASYFKSVGFALAGTKILTDVRGRLYRHMQNLSLSFHSKARNGDMVVRVIGDIGLLRDVVVTALMPLLASLMVLIGMVGVMLWMNWRLALLALSVTPLFMLSSTHFSRRIGEAARKQRKRESAIAATTSEAMGAIQTVQTLSLEDNFADTFNRQNKKSLREGVKARRLAAKLQRSVDVIVTVATGLVLWYGAQLVLRRELTPGDLLVFLAYLKTAFRPVKDFAKYTSRLSKASAAGERVLEVFDRQPDVRDLPNAQPAGSLRGAVRFDNVTFSYDDGRVVLDEMEFDVQKGQRVAIVGPSGIGKSTLVKLLCRLYDPQQGKVMIDGQDIRRYTIESLRSQISSVLQETLLFATSVKDNIACGHADVTIEQVQAAAKSANAHEFIEALPDGYDTILGERGATLSGGQRQRIAIARAVARNTPILILDEPTTGLDQENHNLVTEALGRLCADRTTFIISHDLKLCAMADLILYLQDGRVVESGTHEQMLARNGTYAGLSRIQDAISPDSSPRDSRYATIK